MPAVLHAADEDGARGLRQQRLVQDLQLAVVPGDRLQRHRRDVEIALNRAGKTDECVGKREKTDLANGKRRDATALVF